MRKSRSGATIGGILLTLIAIAVAIFLPDLSGTSTSTPPTQPVIINNGGTNPNNSTSGLPSWLHIFFTNPNPPDDINNGVDRYIVPLIDAATRTIDIASFDLNLPSVLDALVRASGRGVQIRVVADGEHGELELTEDKSPTGKLIETLDVLKEANIPFVSGGRSNGLMHNKMLIVDGSVLVMGSWNFAYNDTYRNNNNILVITEPLIIANYQAKFNEGFEDKRFGAKAEVGALTPELVADGVQVENYFSTVDEVMQKLETYVYGAKKSIYFIAFTYTHETLYSAMIDQYRAGITVSGVIENRGATQGAMVPLHCAGIPVRVDGNKYTMHHKVIIIDESIVITGSFNFTKSADDSNDDNIIVIHSPALAKLYIEEYQRVYSIATEPDTSDDDYITAKAEKCK